MPPCKPVPNLSACTRGREQITGELVYYSANDAKNHPFFSPFPPLKCFLSDRWKLHFPISRVLCHLSFFFFFSFFSRTSVKNAKSYELKSEIEKFRRVFRCIYIVYKVQRRMRESMVFDFQTNETRESMYFVYQRWRGETCESTSLVFRFRRAMFTFRFSPGTPRLTVVRRARFLKVCNNFINLFV